MKRKNKNAFHKKKKEFRFHNVIVQKHNGKTKIRHPAYIFLEEGNLYIYVSLTHSQNVDEHIVITLKENPNDERNSYWIAEIKEDLKSSFSRKQQDWKMSTEDDEKIREFFYKIKK